MNERPVRVARFATTVLAAWMAPLSVGLAADANLPGITSDDPFPQGCVSCHKGETSLKSRLAALKHRNIEGKVDVIPDDCTSCHSEDEGLESMSAIAHSMHYAALSSSEFVTRYGGSCLNCHALATGSGEVTVKSGPKNW